MRMLLAMLALLTLSAAKPVDWTRSVTRTPAGSYVVGNPAARVRLIEFMSYTCPHCAQFHAAAATPLMRDYVARGTVAFEVRNAVRDPLDLAAALATRCGPPARFPGNHAAVLAAQAQLVDGAAKFDPAATANDPVAGLKALSRTSGLTAVMAKRGVAPSSLDACLASKAAQDPVLAMTNDAWNVRKLDGTPAFFVGGKQIGARDWIDIEAALRTALRLKPKAG